MSDPINLNKFRKAKAKAEKEQRAVENRAKFGRTKADKTLDKARADKVIRLTDGHRLKDNPEDRG
ncbi:DUF4169 family protein [Hyphomonas pacifica]|uniref:Uncharacterized protein n=1 Tax=Hyphomonas pacifica TaxID=1280941 RepID=A0A062TX89_9PROT|nr:DUF4169 family protein [Hyphomonas pacifica]MAN45800.1 DUF4169 domain-containing protein [Hyphomonas sp.]MBR9806086.1 DUF4169 family protein [Alphaproteobacteria bacterium]KCZ49401.1 hypothetical protein HY2_03170 [Hyphomonas pacifica]RAN32936.1 hypothetical protein HY11_04400 [Hyphomonas pacifica]RAN33207.1 hypothetical protein HY3_02335 [Hyphomonas pacifica]|tara:strand:- start:1709 stop:1903 length:195 start_codon:yes stop_codon:yes gene_type:complete